MMKLNLKKFNILSKKPIPVDEFQIYFQRLLVYGWFLPGKKWVSLKNLIL